MSSCVKTNFFSKSVKTFDIGSLVVALTNLDAKKLDACAFEPKVLILSFSCIAAIALDISDGIGPKLSI